MKYSRKIWTATCVPAPLSAIEEVRHAMYYAWHTEKQLHHSHMTNQHTHNARHWESYVIYVQQSKLRCKFWLVHFNHSSHFGHHLWPPIVSRHWAVTGNTAGVTWIKGVCSPSLCSLICSCFKWRHCTCFVSLAVNHWRKVARHEREDLDI